MGKKDNYTAALLEDMQNDIKAILEIVVPMKKQVDGIPKIKEDIQEIKLDIHVIKIALTETNIKLSKHIQDKRIHLSPRPSAI